MKINDVLEKIPVDLRKGLFDTNYRPYKKGLARYAHKQLEKWAPGQNISESEDFAFQVIDFFSGAGGMSLGFAAISKEHPFFRVIGGCDIIPTAARSFEKNFQAPNILQDARELLDPKKLEEFLNKVGYDPTKPLVLIGCPPCQGFTSHRKKSWDEEDLRNDLISVFARIAVMLQPACVVMENVPEMLSAKYWDYYNTAKEILTDGGYTVHQSIHNAAGFGVPQERFRAVAIAMKKDFLLPVPVLERENFVTVRDAIGALPEIEAGEKYVLDAYHLSARHKPTTIEVIQAVPKNGGSRPPGIGPKCLDKVRGYADVYGRLYWDKPSITITQYARNPASGRFSHPEQDRGLTMREAALLQSFPQGFYFHGTFDGVFKQIGEAVPPKLACGVAASVLAELASAPIGAEEMIDQENYVVSPVSNSYSSVIAGIKIAAGATK